MKVLVLSPHCDDDCIAMGGTILNYTSNKQNSVHVIYLTGSSERLKEAGVCSKILGTTWECWELEDGAVLPTTSLSKKLKEVAGEYDVVYCPNEFEAHPDHVATFRLAYMAHLDNKLYQYEVWSPLRAPTDTVDITCYLSLKRAAIRAHVSQAVNGFDEAILSLNRYRAIMSGTNAFSMEAFQYGTEV